MLRACVRTVSTPIESVCAIWALVAPSWSSSSTSASRGVRRSDPSRLRLSTPPPAAAERGSTCIPRDARWIALMMSRASVSLDRQAVAPNESIWLHSAAVGRLARTTILVSGYSWCSWKTCAGLWSVPKFTSTTEGSWRSISPSIWVTATSVITSSRLGSSEISCFSPTATRSSNLAASTLTRELFGGATGESLRPNGGERGKRRSPVLHPLSSSQDPTSKGKKKPRSCRIISEPSVGKSGGGRWGHEVLKIFPRADWGTPSKTRADQPRSVFSFLEQQGGADRALPGYPR